jgi:hypothetical protein
MRSVWGIVLIAGCSTSGTTGPAVDPQTCGMQVAPIANQPAMTIGPVATSGDGADVCVHLDATGLKRSHFSANTPMVAGTTSPFTATLEDASFVRIVDSWQVTVGQTDPHTMMNLEWDPPAPVVDVILWVHGPGSTTLALSLIDPLER